MIQTELKAKVAFATLDRPGALNALDGQMCNTLLDAITRWQQDPQVAVIVLRGAGPKAFCAGGDVKAVVSEAARGNEQYAIDFFTAEYRLDFAIHESLKPVVVVAHGYTMGGGIGLLAGAACRVVTTSSVLSMPEISIGLFPDVGGSYFLQDAPGKLGPFFALTAARLNAADALFARLADHFIADSRVDSFLGSLVAASWSADSDENRRTVKRLAAQAAAASKDALPESQWAPRQARIDAALAGNEPHAALARLASLVDDRDECLAHAARAFALGSPTSAFVIWEQLKRGLTLSLAACFRLELGLGVQCVRHHDFREGVRALLIDKDGKPAWQPARREEVTRELVLEHFQSPWPPTTHPLRDLA